MSFLLRQSRATRKVVCSVRAFSSGFGESELRALSVSRHGKATKVYLPSPDLLLVPGGTGGHEQRRLLVVMVGWALSRHNTLSKYASIYTELGIPCIALATPVQWMWFTTLGSKAMRNTLRLLDHSMQLPVSILLHIFSGGGTAVLPQLMEEHANPNSPFPSKLRPAGVVFDSAPVLFSRKAGLAASKLFYKQGGTNVLSYSLVNMVGILTDLAFGSRKRREGETALAHPQLLQMPQLYLYSENDSVNPLERTKMVMEGQREKGRDVTGKCWMDTEHVRHYTKHPEEYSEQIADFVATLHCTRT